MANAQGGTIEVDPALADSNQECYEASAYRTVSLSSSINSYVVENGRKYSTYFGVDKNPLPVDELEQDRLDMHHDIFLQLLDGELYKAPIKNPQRIMDVGTGTGIWAIDVADKFPETEVIGVDLSPIQPQWVPPKCKFEVDDAEQEWPYPSNTFDFVHARNIVQGISDWPKLMSEVFRCTKPGGYVELAELGSTVYCDDDSMADDNAIKIYFETITYAMTKIGRPPANGEFLMRNLENAGFVDIVEDTKKQPIGPWPKDPKLKNVGAMVMLNTEVAFHSYGMAVFTRVLGMSTEEAERLCDAAFAAARNKNNHTYNLFHIVYARKPERC